MGQGNKPLTQHFNNATLFCSRRNTYVRFVCSLSRKPGPFEQPFLVLQFRNESRPYKGSAMSWMIDIGGEISLYLNNYEQALKAYEAMSYEEKQEKKVWVGIVASEGFNWLSQATPLLQSMIASLKGQGYLVIHVSVYQGSAGPSHILRCGAIFERMDTSRLPLLYEANLGEIPRDVAPELHKLGITV